MGRSNFRERIEPLPIIHRGVASPIGEDRAPRCHNSPVCCFGQRGEAERKGVQRGVPGAVWESQGPKRSGER